MNLGFSFVMPSDPRFLCVARASISELGSVSGLSDKECRDVTLAMDEALANIIRHAYKNRYDQAIEVKCEISNDRLEFTLFDQGEPPDPVKICSQPMNAVSLSGRGTHMMKLLMDEVSYERVSRGNQLTLRKNLHSENAKGGKEA
jgi:anti-sigma regulatory factor (Ser/Thr protein kinase)